MFVRRSHACVADVRPELDVAPPAPTHPHPPQFRARLWLFVSFLIAAGAVAGSVAVLVSASAQQQQEGGKDMSHVGVVRRSRVRCS